MRKITREAVNNFNNNLGPFKKANTEVEYRALIDIFDHIFYDARVFKLHGNIIAVYNSLHGLFITNAGWQTNTTKELLNAINGVSIHQKKGLWYLNGKEWDGKPVKVS